MTTPRTHRLLFASVLAALPTTACAASQSSVPVDAAPTSAAAAPEKSEFSLTELPSIPLPSSMHPTRVTEVVTTDSGRSALTLDAHGGVRLWPDLHAEDVSAPIELPVADPRSMTLATTEEGFMVAFVDTSGGAIVGRIVVGEGAPQWTTTFERPPSNPLFELHIVDRGQRLLALGVDHRLHLWSPLGESLATLDEPGFVPWQLRLAEAADGSAVAVAVLARPSAVQVLDLGKPGHDHIETIGEPVGFDLDRGPNLNDLVLTPDGKQLVVLRRPNHKKRILHLEVVDLKSRARRILALEGDVRAWPRLHVPSSEFALLETTSGKGLRVRLEHAKPFSPPAQGEKLDEDAIALSPTEAFVLHRSTEDTMVHTVVAGNARIMPFGRGLVIDDIESDRHRELASKTLRPSAVALDHEGGQVAWATRDEVVVEALEGAASKPSTTPIAGARALAFVDHDHLVAVEPKGRTTLHRIGGSEAIAETELEVDWGVGPSGWRGAGDAQGGALVVSALRPTARVSVLSVTPTGFGTHDTVAPSARDQWPEAGRPPKEDAHVWLGKLGLDWDEMGLRHAKLRITEPDPTGTLVATVLEIQDFREPSNRANPPNYIVTVYDREKHVTRWTRPAWSFRDIAWSGDGTRLVFADATGGFVCDAHAGTMIAERHDLGLVASEAKDEIIRPDDGRP